MPNGWPWPSTCRWISTERLTLFGDRLSSRKILIERSQKIHQHHYGLKAHFCLTSQYPVTNRWIQSKTVFALKLPQDNKSPQQQAGSSKLNPLASEVFSCYCFQEIQSGQQSILMAIFSTAKESFQLKHVHFEFQNLKSEATLVRAWQKEDPPWSSCLT